MKILVACEYSGVVRDAFRAKGHDAWSADRLPTEGNPEYNQYHYQGGVGMVLFQGWDMIIAHPPCTYLTNAGARHLHSHVTSRNGVRAKVHGQARFDAMEEACDFFNLFKGAAPKVCIENPVPHKYAKAHIGQYTQLIRPWQFGHKENKGTCLWLEGLPKLVPTNVIGPPPKKGTVSNEEYKSWFTLNNLSQTANRAKLRSKTFQGIANAMAEQWG